MLFLRSAFYLLGGDFPSQPLHLPMLFLRFQFPGSHPFGFAGGDSFLADSFTFLDPPGETLQCVLHVPVLGALAAADDDDTGGEVLETDRGIGDVPVLTPRPTGPEGGNAALFF